MDDQIGYKVWFRDAKGTLRCVELKAKSFKAARDYGVIHRDSIESAVKQRIKGPLLICLNGGKV